jgi:phage shock protein C
VNDRLYRSRSDRMLAGVAGGLAEIWDADPSLIRIIWALLVILTGGIALVVYIVMAIVVPEEDEVWPATPTGAMPMAAAPDAAATPGPAAAAAGPDAAAQPIDPATGQPFVPPPPAPGALWAPATPADARRVARSQARAEARAARRAARAARGDDGGLPATVIGGIVLVALGVFFLARQWLPQLDFDYFWPLVLIGLGVLLLVGAFGRRPRNPGAPGAPGASGTSGDAGIST